MSAGTVDALVKAGHCVSAERALESLEPLLDATVQGFEITDPPGQDSTIRILTSRGAVEFSAKHLGFKVIGTESSH